MNEIKCPKCGEIFQIDETSYAAIVKQVRDSEFQSEIETREKALNKEMDDAVALAKSQTEKELNEIISRKESKIVELNAKINSNKNELDLAISRLTGEKDKEIAKLKSKLQNAEIDKQLAVKNTESQKDKEISEKEIEIEKLNAKIESNEREYTSKENTLKEKFQEELRLKEEQVALYKDFKAKQSTKMIGESLENILLADEIEL